MHGKLIPAVVTQMHSHSTEFELEFEFELNIKCEHRFIFTMDIKSLYTVIPKDEGLRALKYFLDKREVQDPPTHTLLRMAELVLTLNSFVFNGEHYKQIGGVLHFLP